MRTNENENNTAADVETGTEESTESPAPITAASLQIRVAAEIAGSGEQVADKVVNLLAGKEISNRADNLSKVVTKVQGFNKDMNKLRRPDVDGTFAADDSVVTPPSFSGSRQKEIKKLQERIDGHNNAVTKAIERNDWDKLNELAGKK